MVSADSVVRGEAEYNGLLSPVRVGVDMGRWTPVPRGYPEGMEVLTEFGFVDFRLLFSDEYLGEPAPFVLGKPSVLTDMMGGIEWGQWKVSKSFPRVASVNPITGDIVFLRPVRMSYYNYRGKLVEVRGKGVNILSSLEADLLLRENNGRDWKFMPAKRLSFFKKFNTKFYINNKFNENLYGDYVPQRLNTPSDSEYDEVGFNSRERGMLVTELRPRLKYPFTIEGRKHVKMKLLKYVYDYFGLDAEGKRIKNGEPRKTVPLYNIDVPPYHTIIVRRGKIRDTVTETYSGQPVIVGDGLDKSLIRMASIGRGVKINIADDSYSDLRPDGKYIRSDSGDIIRNAYAEEYDNE